MPTQGSQTSMAEHITFIRRVRIVNCSTNSMADSQSLQLIEATLLEQAMARTGDVHTITGDIVGDSEFSMTLVHGSA